MVIDEAVNMPLEETLESLFDQGQSEQLLLLLQEQRPADLAEALNRTDRSKRREMFHLLSPQQAAEVISECNEDLMLDLMSALDEDQLSRVIEELPPDDAADAVGELPEDKAHRVLSKLDVEDSEDIRDLLKYEEDTAGGIMTPDVIAFPETMSVEAVLHAFRGTWQSEKSTEPFPPSSEVLRIAYELIREENVFSIFVVDHHHKLVGFVRMQDLICARPDTRLSEIADHDVIFVHTDEDQEAVAEIAHKYSLLSIPVVDSQGRLEGRVTIDDLMDVVQEETTEDIMKMAGTHEDELITRSALRSMVLRLPWLLAALLGLLLSSTIYHYFEQHLAIVAILAPFIPVIGGMSGNTGVQSATIMVRGMATGQIDINRYLSIMLKEIRSGILLGVVLGTLVGLAVVVLTANYQLAEVVGIAVLIAITWASIVGILIPAFLVRLGKDPAVATGPVVTSLNDAVSALIYIYVAYLLM